MGSIEQHGPHMPLGTDMILASELARRAAALVPEAVLVPAIPVGYAAYHGDFPGTLSTSPATLATYLGDICHHLVRHGITHIIFVNGHGGNLSTLELVGRELRRKGIAGLDGDTLWTRRLPDDCFGVDWAATPHGLAVAVLTQERCPIHHLGPDGSPAYSIPVPAGERYGLRYYRDVLLLTSYSRISAYRAGDGSFLWEVHQPGVSSLPAGFHEHENWVLTGDTLIVRYGAGIVACSLHTGSISWQYNPPGYAYDVAVAGDMAYVTSSRGIFAVPLPAPAPTP
ncbi:MAG: creatininase family protein [Firmicutes bacterium]|nr:creatininase family protein [Bacillota bacterium]